MSPMSAYDFRLVLEIIIVYGTLVSVLYSDTSRLDNWHRVPGLIKCVVYQSALILVWIPLKMKSICRAWSDADKKLVYTTGSVFFDQTCVSSVFLCFSVLSQFLSWLQINLIGTSHNESIFSGVHQQWSESIRISLHYFSLPAQMLGQIFKKKNETKTKSQTRQ